MSPRLLIVLICLQAGWAGSVRAQIDLVFRVESTELIELEPISAVVTLANRSEQPKRVGEDYRLTFEVLDGNGVRVKMRDNAVTWVPAELPAGATLIFTNNLSFLYRMDQQGHYTVAARLHAGHRDLVSERVYLDVLKGSELLALDADAPDGTSRRYSLRQISRNQKSRLYLRVDDPIAAMCYGVFDLGRYLPFRAPILQVDNYGLVHVLHLTAPTFFLHSIFSPMGELVAQQNHVGDASSVRLAPDPEAGFRVIGVGISEPRDPFIDTLPGRKRL